MSGKKEMVVWPEELTQVGKLEGKRLVGRVLDAQKATAPERFSAYLLCGNRRQDIIAIEAWREVALVAEQKLKNQELVILSMVTLSTRAPGKNKYSQGKCQFVVKYDKHTVVSQMNAEEAAQMRCGGKILVCDIPQTLPIIGLQSASALNDTVVNVRVLVVENGVIPASGQRSQLRKLVVEDSSLRGEAFSAEVLCWGELAEATANISANDVVDLFHLQANVSEKSSWSLKWTGRSCFEVVDAAGAEVLRKALRGKSRTQLSVYQGGTEQKDYASATARVVTLSVLGLLLPERDAKQMSPDMVWEIPWCTIAHIYASGRSPEEPWYYSGCSICSRKECTKHAGGVRRCYTLEVQTWDHTGSLALKMFNRTADLLFQSALGLSAGTEIENQGKAREEIRQCLFTIRCVMSMEEAYGSRAAKNVWQVVHIRKEDPEKFTGGGKPILEVPPHSCGLGVPLASLGEVSVNAAGDAVLSGDRPFQFLEGIMVLSQQNPIQEGSDNESGVRVYWNVEDASDKTSARIMWVVPLDQSVSVILLPKGTMYRAILKPMIDCDAQGVSAVEYWQVVFHTSLAAEALEGWQKRKKWQRESRQPEDRGWQREMLAMTPIGRGKRLWAEMASPSG